jgi:hypothetical protein
MTKTHADVKTSWRSRSEPLVKLEACKSHNADHHLATRALRRGKEVFQATQSSQHLGSKIQRSERKEGQIVRPV